MVSSRADAYTAIIRRYKDLYEMGYVTKEDKTYMQAASLDYCGQAEKIDESLYQMAVEIVEAIDKTPDGFGLKHRLKLMIWKVNKYVYRAIYKICGRQIK